MTYLENLCFLFWYLWVLVPRGKKLLPEKTARMPLKLKLWQPLSHFSLLMLQAWYARKRTANLASDSGYEEKVGLLLYGQ